MLFAVKPHLIVNRAAYNLMADIDGVWGAPEGGSIDGKKVAEVAFSCLGMIYEAGQCDIAYKNIHIGY